MCDSNTPWATPLPPSSPSHSVVTDANSVVTETPSSVPPDAHSGDVLDSVLRRTVPSVVTESHSVVTESHSVVTETPSAPFIPRCVRLLDSAVADAGDGSVADGSVADTPIVSNAEILRSAQQVWSVNNIALKSIRDLNEDPRGTPSIWGVDLTDDGPLNVRNLLLAT